MKTRSPDQKERLISQFALRRQVEQHLTDDVIVAIEALQSFYNRSFDAAESVQMIFELNDYLDDYQNHLLPQLLKKRGPYSSEGFNLAIKYLKDEIKQAEKCLKNLLVFLNDHLLCSDTDQAGVLRIQGVLNRFKKIQLRLQKNKRRRSQKILATLILTYEFFLIDQRKRLNLLKKRQGAAPVK